MTKDEDEILKIVNNEDLDVKAMRVLNDGRLIRLDYKPKKEKAVRTGSIVLALMTTAYARIKLYEVIAAYPKETIYFDTDSVFLLLPEGVEGPPTSNRLGGLKDEVKETYGAGCRIISFASLGPKTYTYTVVDAEGKVVAVELKKLATCQE